MGFLIRKIKTDTSRFFNKKASKFSDECRDWHEMKAENEVPYNSIFK